MAPNSDSSSACKVTGSGDHYYEFTLVWDNTLEVSSTLCLTGGSMVPNGCPAVDVILATASPQACVPVPAGGQATIVVDSEVTSCLANGVMSVTYTYTDSTGAIVSDDATVTFNTVLPCK